MIKKNICLIPARGGSKRVKNKNIKKFLGKPLLERVIKTAKKSNLFDKIYVSTDSILIKKLAIKSLNLKYFPKKPDVIAAIRGKKIIKYSI